MQDVGVSVPEDLVKDVTELPAEDGAAGQRQADGIGPEGKGSLLMMRAQDDTPGMLLLHWGLLAVDGFADTDGL